MEQKVISWLCHRETVKCQAELSMEAQAYNYSSQKERYNLCHMTATYHTIDGRKLCKRHAQQWALEYLLGDKQFERKRAV